MISISKVQPAILPPLYSRFCPASLVNRAFREAVRASGRGVPLILALERGGGQIASITRRSSRLTVTGRR